MFLQRGQSGTPSSKHSPKRDLSEKLTNMRAVRLWELGLWIVSFMICTIPDGAIAAKRVLPKQDR